MSEATNGITLEVTPMAALCSVRLWVGTEWVHVRTADSLVDGETLARQLQTRLKEILAVEVAVVTRKPTPTKADGMQIPLM